MRNRDTPFRQGVRNGYLIATLGVAAATAVLSLMRSELDKAHVGLVFLLLVGAAAAAGGTRPALLAAVLSFLCWDFFFLPPLYTFALRDVRDWLLLFAYLVIGALVGQITGRLRARSGGGGARAGNTVVTVDRVQMPQVIRHLVETHWSIQTPLCASALYCKPTVSIFG